MEVRISADGDHMAALCAATITRWVSDGASLGLAGGSTPRQTYRRLASEPIPWERVTLWLSDERWVPRHHEGSNTAMVTAALGKDVAADLLEIPDVGAGDPAAAAAAYDATLGERVGDHPDVVLLGLGADGHTASLFPGSAAVEATEGRYVANWVESMSSWRLTATLHYLQAATELAFVVTGSGKAEAVAAVLGGESSLPAALVARGASSVTWFLDAAAAAAL
jgi:6-phosphogluconolactonase